MAIIILYVVVAAGFISRAFNSDVSMLHNIVTFGGLAVLALCESILRGGKK